MRAFLIVIMTFAVTFCVAMGITGGKNIALTLPQTDTVTASQPQNVRHGGASAKKSAQKETKGTRKTNSDTLKVKNDTLAGGHTVTLTPDSTGRNISFQVDSLQSDTAKADTAKKKKDALDAPVEYEAKDSIVYYSSNKTSTLFGDSKVTYQDMNLNAEIIAMNLDSSIVHAVGVRDSIGEWKGSPVYKQGEEDYQSERMSYNFKTKKGFIQNVATEQGEGFMNSQSSKRSKDGTLFLEHAKYTTCDADPPHFYLALSRAKVYPGKEAIFGPAYLVVEDVPLPIAVPFGFFPFRKKYSSGFLMPTYGDETNRGFYLRDGGYYFAISDMMDLKLLGEIYTKGSWGLNAETNYRKRYKYAGNFYLNYQNTVVGEKNMPDYEKTTSFKIQWTHRQDAKASMNSSLSASVNFATTSFERNNLTSMYNPLSYTQSTRTSSVSYSHTFPTLGLTIAASGNLSQNMQDSTIAMSFPELNVTLSRFYPFKRKMQVGKARWYEKISMSYTGRLSNSISTKEDKLLHSNLIKDWRNGMSHNIPLSASFSVLKYINLTPTFTFYDRMYTNKIMQSWDMASRSVLRDTLYGFYNVYNWNFSVAANTTLYGFYKPWKKLFGDRIIAVRHVLKPTVSYNYAPDFSSNHYGYYDSYVRTDADGNVSTVTYSPFSSGIFGVPSRGRTGSIALTLSNNVEMKVKSERDSTGEKKISLIDELYGALSYNMANKSRPWSDLSTRLRLKLWKNYTFSMAAVFATYAYQFDERGNVYVGNRTEWSYGRFGRFQGMSQNLSYTISNATFKKKKRQDSSSNNASSADDTSTDDDDDTYDDYGDADSNVDPTLTASRQQTTSEDEGQKVDDDGYLKFSIPWTFTVSYGISMTENRTAKINPKTMRYPYQFTQTLNFSGNIRLSDGWNINYSSGYDFNYHKLSMTTASLTRDLHCFSMSCSVVLRPYTSYNFSFRAKISTLADILKWDKRSSYSSNIDWY